MATDPLDPKNDRPYHLTEEEERSGSRWWLWIAALALVSAGVAWYFWQQREAPPPAPVAEAPPPPPAESGKPAIRYPIDPSAAPEPEKPLPSLEQSDAYARELATALVHPRVFDALAQPAHFIRRVVATVDNLPRKTAPVAMMPLKPVPRAFIPGPANEARYAAYVRVVETIPARELVKRYAAAYPLFQRAYEELGFPGRYFNDRLVEAIDDLLAAPDLKGPPEVVQPKVLYEYADPDLEKRSAGQKILMRMGPRNAAKVKAKLREIRAELMALALKPKP